MALEQNLQNQQSSEVFSLINKYSDEFRDELNLFYTISWARVNIITHLLVQKIKKTELKLNEDGILEEAIYACKDLTWNTDDECERILHSLNELGIKPLDELVEKGIIHRHEAENNHVTLSINEDLLQFEDYILKLNFLLSCELAYFWADR